MGLTDVTNPAIGEMTIRVTSGSTAVEFDRFLEYDYKENYLEASDSLSFTLDQRELSRTDAGVLVPGAIVEPCVDGKVQSRSILDEPQATFSRDEGNVVRCEARDWLSVAVDGQVDPQTRFLPGMTLLDLIVAAYSTINPNITVFADSIANRNAITGLTVGETSSAAAIQAAQQNVSNARSKPFTPENQEAVRNAESQLQQAQQSALAQRSKTTSKGRPTKHFTLGQEKPYPNEGLFAFTSRVAQRFGLWIRPYVDGESISVASPDYTQPPRYGICHAFDEKRVMNNVERGTFAKNRKDQPSIIYASGFGGGGNFAKSRLRAGIVNRAVNADNSKIISAYSDVPLIDIDPITAAFPPLVEDAARPAFLYDPESHTQEQLEAFLRRELSLRMRKALTARYEIMGHVLNGQPIAVDTICAVLDQQPVADWNGPMWVLARNFRKSAKGGARSTIDMVLPGSIQF